MSGEQRQSINAHTVTQAVAAFDAARNLSDIARAQHFEIERLRGWLGHIRDGKVPAFAAAVMALDGRPLPQPEWSDLESTK